MSQKIEACKLTQNKYFKYRIRSYRKTAEMNNVRSFEIFDIFSWYKSIASERTVLLFQNKLTLCFESTFRVFEL